MRIFYFESVDVVSPSHWQDKKCVWFFHNILNANQCYGNELLLCEIKKNLQIKVKIITSGRAEASQVPIGEI